MEINWRLLPRYLKSMGLLHGLIVFYKVEVFQYEKFSIHGIKSNLYLRRNSTDRDVFREVFLFESYKVVVANPLLIIDGGANIGLTSVYLANRYPQALIYAIEPSESNFEVLKKNISDYPTIIPILSAIWSHDTYLKISNKNEHAWAYTVVEADASDSDAFKATSLETFMKTYSIEVIDLLKLDIEGAELELFSSFHEYWLKRTRHLIIELHDWMRPTCSRTVFKTISGYPFTTTIVNGMLMFTNSQLK